MEVFDDGVALRMISDMILLATRHWAMSVAQRRLVLRIVKQVFFSLSFRIHRRLVLNEMDLFFLSSASTRGHMRVIVFEGNKDAVADACTLSLWDDGTAHCI